MLHVILKSIFFPQDIRRKQQGEIMARKGEKAIDLPSLKMQVMISKKKKELEFHISSCL